MGMADQREQLQSVVADFFETSPTTVGADFVLGGQRLASSIARAGLDAAIRRRVGVKLPAVYSARTYGELESAMLGEAVAGTGGVATTNGSPVFSIGAVSSRIRCGVDVESIANLPEADDYWEHDFYKTHFSKAEIAYCLTTENPREHFAARWAAREALSKSDARFIEVNSSDVQVAVDDRGAPRLEWLTGDGVTTLPFAVSLTHSADLAIAVVVGGGDDGRDVEKPSIMEAVDSQVMSGADVATRGGFGLTGLLAVASLIASMVAIWRTL